MEWLLAYSSEQTGHTGLAEALAASLGARLLNTDLSDAAWPDEAPDALLLLNGLQWYLHNRLSLRGRPWVCAASYCFEDLRQLIELNANISDTGVHVLFHNCAEFMRRVSAAMPARFCWQPLSRVPVAREREREPGLCTVGTVLPNVMDRDFSQVLYTYQAFLRAGAAERFVVYGRPNERMRLPEELRPALRVYEDMVDAFDQLDYFVPAPRVNDYRIGIVPSEVVWAAHCGCVPLLIYHPLMGVLERVGFTLEKSLRAYDTTINLVLTRDERSSEIRRVEMPDSMRFVAEQFVNEVKVARARWQANAGR